MKIITHVLQDPTDIILQGAVIGDTLLSYTPAFGESAVWSILPVLQGQVIGDYAMSQPVPSAMIGQHDWYGIKPRMIGPMVMSGGEVIMLDIGSKPIDVYVGPIQRWLNSVFQIDNTGFMMTLYDDKTIGAPEAIAQFMLAEPETMGNPVVNIPRGAICQSGLIKRMTCPKLPASFGRHTVMDDFVETTRKYFIDGVTKDSTGAALGNCRVLVMVTDKIGVNPDILANPIVADLMSDGNGNYSVQTNNNRPFQIMDYKAGSPDVAGITVNTVIPTDG